MDKVDLKNAKPPFFAGVDVGGTSIKVGIVDDAGKTVAFGNLPTPSNLGPDIAIGQIKDQINQLSNELSLNGGEVVWVGLGTPGTMDIPKGMILEPPNLPAWRNFPIRDELAKVIGLPVTYANDASAAAFGEYWTGSARRHRSIVLLTLGTGVGGGIILDGHSVVGESSHGAECGHVVIDNSPDARECSCGLKGHLEAYASATALIKRCEEALDAGEPSILSEIRAAGETLKGVTISAAAEQGDAFAEKLILETADYLASGVAIFLNTIDPSAVVLGGAMNFGGESHPVGKMFIERVRDRAFGLALPVVANSAVITFAELGGDAGYIGAAGLARNEYYRSKNQIVPQS